MALSHPDFAICGSIVVESDLQNSIGCEAEGGAVASKLGSSECGRGQVLVGRGAGDGSVHGRSYRMGRSTRPGEF